MKTQIAFLTFLMISIFYFSGCQTDEPEPELQITLKDASDITETSFVINWTLNRSAIKSISIDVSSNDSFSVDLKTIAVANTANTSQKVDCLHGATTYYIRLNVTLDDGVKKTSNTKDVSTRYTSELVKVFTIDGIKIGGEINYISGDRSKRPGVILMGSYSRPNTWMRKDFFKTLLASGYVCYVFDWRGHGMSGNWEMPQNDVELREFVSTHALNDLKACYEYFKGHELIDPDRLALIGCSLGATESLNGNYLPGIKASVAMSAFLFGLNTDHTHKNVFLIACEEDNTDIGNSVELAQLIYDVAAEPKKLLILPGSEHGYGVLDASPEVNVRQEILDWLTIRLDNK